MTYRIEFGPHIDWKSFRRLSSNDKERIRIMIHEKLGTQPSHFGKPMRSSLFPLWSLRIGVYRIIYRIEGTTVRIELIGYRSTIYREAQKLI